jgi:hypothetical protein
VFDDASEQSVEAPVPGAGGRRDTQSHSQGRIRSSQVRGQLPHGSQCSVFVSMNEEGADFFGCPSGGSPSGGQCDKLLPEWSKEAVEAVDRGVFFAAFKFEESCLAGPGQASERATGHASIAAG